MEGRLGVIIATFLADLSAGRLRARRLRRRVDRGGFRRRRGRVPLLWRERLMEMVRRREEVVVVRVRVRLRGLVVVVVVVA